MLSPRLGDGWHLTTTLLLLPPTTTTAMDRGGATWPATTGAARYSAFTPSSRPRLRGDRRRPRPDATSDLPFDVMIRIAAAFAGPDLIAASLVCRSWRDSLRPLREAVFLHRRGKKLKHGRDGVPTDIGKALECFLKGVVRGSTVAMVDAGLIYWEMGKREKAISLYQRAADLGDLSGQCNLGISYLKGKAFISF